MNDEITHKLFKLIEQHPNLSQRELAKEMGVSLGKTNYCIKGLMEKGWLKARNFKNNQNKIAYAYVLTPKGLREKANITARYLKRKLSEYETLKVEIRKLREEVSETS
ncbi:MAG: MarR family EPS-associated transcriptional regulator [Gammaproteobacteria bacterium]